MLFKITSSKYCVWFMLTLNNKFLNMELLVILFFYKLYDHINIFKHIKEYVQSEIKMSRIIQKQHTKTTMIKFDINYLL